MNVRVRSTRLLKEQGTQHQYSYHDVCHDGSSWSECQYKARALQTDRADPATSTRWIWRGQHWQRRHQPRLLPFERVNDATSDRL